MEENKAKIKKEKVVVAKPRLFVFRSNKEIYAQVIAKDGEILASASSLKESGKNKTLLAEVVGKNVAEAAVKKGVKVVVFDRGNSRYHGRVKALADAARSAGLEF